MKNLTLTLTMLFVVLIVAPMAGAMENADVVKLVEAGLSDDLVAEQVRRSYTDGSADFNTSVDGLIELKEAGVPESIIRTMMGASDSTTPTATNHPSASVISLNGESISLEAMNVREGTALGTMFTGGLKPIKLFGSFRGLSAETRTDSALPQFVFQASREMGLNSPRQLSLARMSREDGNRDVCVGKKGIIGKDSCSEGEIPFSYEETPTGTFVITPNDQLSSGEYVFFFKTEGGGLGLPSASGFAFGVGNGDSSVVGSDHDTEEEVGAREKLRRLKKRLPFGNN